MPGNRIPLTGRAYVERSKIAGAMETINWYAELNDADSTAPTPITYYPTPGVTLKSSPNTAAKSRCTYRTSIGTAYTVIGPTVYFYATNGALVFVGTIPDIPSQVIMSDNGLVAILVDGTGTGYAIDLITNDFAPITDPSFYGANFVVYLLTFFVFNRPGTNQFYISLSQVNFAMLTGTAIGNVFIDMAGTGGTPGVYQSVPLTGGSGTDATADITVSSGIIATGSITPGSLYTNGFYPGIPLTGGTGNGFVVDITVAGGSVIAVVFSNNGDLQGIDYSVGDVLTCDPSLIGGTGSGFEYTVNTVVSGVSDVEIDDLGQGYLVTDTLSAAAADIGGTVGFEITVESTALAFDPLDIAAKSGSADPIVAILAVHEELILVGQLTTEIWDGTGAADFFFQQVQGAYIEHGCIAPYTSSFQDVLGFWLMQDRQGKNIVVEYSNYDITEISTPFLVDRFNNFTTTADAIGFCFQIDQHPFYCLVFPTANETWLYEIQSKQWNKWQFLNINDGSLNRHRANCCMFFNGDVYVGDWQNGSLYTLSAEVYTDNGVPIVRIKTFLHMLDDLDRVKYANFDADVEVATQDATIITQPLIFLDWSDDRGVTYGNPVGQTLGLGGETKTTVTWNRLGYARDRVFRLTTSEPIKLALNGGFASPVKGRT